MPELLIVDPKGGEQRLELNVSEYVIGRDPSCSIRIQDSRISRRHARIFLAGKDYFIEDAGSSNGVLYEGVRLLGPRNLASPGYFDIGGFLFVVLNDPAGQRSPFLLQGLSEPVNGKEFVLQCGCVDVGRDAQTAIPIVEGSISRRHATLIVTSQNVFVADRESSNGVFVNDERVQLRSVHLGDHIRFGNVRFALAGGLSQNSRRQSAFSRFVSLEPSQRIVAILAGLSALLLIAAIGIGIQRSRIFSGWSLFPVDQEAEFLRNVSEKLVAAKLQLHNENWQAAREQFDLVLELDPLHEEARVGRQAALDHIECQQILKDMEINVKQKAAVTLLHFGEISPSAPCYDDAAIFARQAHVQIALQAEHDAATACAKKNFRTCQHDAVVALTHTPESQNARKLLERAEAGLKQQGERFISWLD